MLRKLRTAEASTCADCSAPDPSWASINRGVLVCDECCSVHRSLGRHLSQVKHLQHSSWPPALFKMVQTLVSGGANTIWEYTLLDPAQMQSGRRKPNPQDKLQKAGHTDLADRLLECQYELTDRLLSYVCGRKPDHRNGQHFITPQMADSLDLSEFAKAAKKQLQSLSNRLFEDLAMDVYDEVDRREVDAVWLATQSHSTLVSERPVVPFLPLNPDYSSPRNQGRQKLARFNPREFATLIVDILSEAKRRQHAFSRKSARGDIELEAVNGCLQGGSNEIEEQPDYDDVPSEDEVSTVFTPNSQEQHTDGQEDLGQSVSPREFVDLKESLARSEQKVQQLLVVNSSLSEAVGVLQHEVKKLHSENITLRQSVYHESPRTSVALPDHPEVSGGKVWRPVSMYETGWRASQPPASDLSTTQGAMGVQQFHNTMSGNRIQRPGTRHTAYVTGQTDFSRPACFPSSSNPHYSLGPMHTSGLAQNLESQNLWSKTTSTEKRSSDTNSDYDNTPHNGGNTAKRPEEADEVMGLELEVSQTMDTRVASLSPDSKLPSVEDVIRKTEQITKNIQEILRAAQESNHDSGGTEHGAPRKSRQSTGCFSGLMLRAERPSTAQESLQPSRPNSLHWYLLPSVTCTTFTSFCNLALCGHAFCLGVGFAPLQFGLSLHGKLKTGVSL
uniref:GIT ArfGAP 1 n=1 Tax=Eptatretus burgeri TaxID=7764 RepID=A0A8C4Q948_EPTBU